MTALFRQLRERGVLRVAGLYIALVWLLLQIADIVFPAFEIPDSAVRYILYAAMAGFPGALIFAWFFELTDKGIQLESHLEESGAHRLKTGRYIYLVTIGALLLALTISVFFNVQQVAEDPVVEPENMSLLIADIDNKTGDPVFNGALEQALTIGLEGASFITAFQRPNAVKIADKINTGDGLDEERARLVAVREGITLVLAASIRRDGDGFTMFASAKEPQTGEVLAEASADADSKLAVLQAVGDLANQIREALGDVTITEDSARFSESFSTASLEAVGFYNRAQAASQNGRDKEAAEYYEKAVEEDPNFGRAYSGWALSVSNLGETGKSAELWDKALSLVGGMTERERYRTLGVYYSVVTRNFGKAIENYELLVEKFPADAIGHNNLAVSYFYSMRFDKALAEGKSIHDIYPNNPLFHSNYALYAMYAGDFETALTEANLLLQNDNQFYKAYLPVAMANLANGNTESARSAYRSMMSVDSRGTSTANMGLADIALLEGDYAAAIEILTTAIAVDAQANNQRGQATKYIAMAEAYAGLNDAAATRESLAQALALSQSLQTQVPAARMLIELGDLEQASSIQDELRSQLQRASRAAADLTQGRILLARGDAVGAVDALLSAQQRLDSWVIRLELGKAYFAAGYYAEALSEFELCKERIGEAAALFLDDMPTFHRSREVQPWLARTRQALGSVVTEEQG